MRKAEVNFNKKIRTWDGFGVNYVELAQCIDYEKSPQEYGGFSILSEEDRQEIIDMIFGENGLKPGTVKMFLDPFHQEKEHKNNSALGALNMDNYDHNTTTKWMRYFVKNGLKKTRERGGSLDIITTLYGPPYWMTQQKLLRGRDLDPDYKEELAKYMISWVKFLKEEEGLPVKYISLHNEGEDWHRWPLDGSSGNIGSGHDYNMYWPPELVVEFIELIPDLLELHGLSGVGITPGETSRWHRFLDWGYADAILESNKALQNMALITSHGFYRGNFGFWYAPHDSLGIDKLREKRPELHAWNTSTSWGNMDSKFVYELKSSIYQCKVNSIIPWACVQRPKQWVGGDPNPGTAFKIFEDGTYQVMPGYYYYKQVSSVGQPGMGVVRTLVNDSEIALIAFSSNGTDNPDAFIVLNIADKEKEVDIHIKGILSDEFSVTRTSPNEHFRSLDNIKTNDNIIKYTAAADSVTTFTTT